MDRSNTGGTLVEKTGRELQEIHHAVNEINTSMGAITNATSEQLIGVDTIHNSLETLDTHMHQATGSLRSATESTKDILQKSQDLVFAMSKFQLGSQTDSEVTQNSSPRGSAASDNTPLQSENKRLAA